MLLDKNGNPVSSTRKQWLIRVSRYKSALKSKGAWIITALGTIAIVLANLSNILDFYERVTDGPEFIIPIDVSNTRKESVQVSRLLDLYITATQFHSGRLISGELPTSRVSLKPDTGTASYDILSGDTKKYRITIQERPYKARLFSGGNTIVFVLHLKGSNEMYSIEQPFHRDVMDSIRLSYTIE